jgi:ABC-2 type transport system ATP-binding protein
VVPAIRVEDVHKRFAEVEAVRGVSFEVRRGEVFGIVGPNGAGKTTTLEMVEGLRPPDDGLIEILGEPVWPHPQRVQRRIGVQLQTTALFDQLSARELLELFGRLYGRLPRGRIEAVLATVGLEGKARARVNALSGGQQQRLAIALALVHQPEIVFLDEPTTGLDPQARRHLWDVVEAIEAEGRTVVLTTHYMEEAESLCERVAIMDAGGIIALDTPLGLVGMLGGASRISFRPDGLERGALAGLPGVRGLRDDAEALELSSDDSPATLAALLSLAPTVDDLAVSRPSLEDVFLELTGREFRE